MILPSDLARAVKRGKKTLVLLTRRRAVPCPVEAGRHYALQAHREGDRSAGKAVCRVEVLDVAQAVLGDVTNELAHRLGFENLGAVLDRWEELTCTRWAEVDGRRARVRVRGRDVDLAQPVWVVGVRLWVPHRRSRSAPVRLLAEQRGLRHPPAYTGQRSHALVDEPEAIDPVDIVAGRWSRQAAARFELERLELAAVYRGLPVAERVDRLRRLALVRGVDVSRDLRVVAVRLAGGGVDAMVERRLLEVEHRLARAA